MAGKGPAISVASLGPGEHSGWMTKQGGSYKSWKRRWFVLKGNKLYYFKSKKDSDITGIVELSNTSSVTKQPKKRCKHCFAVACNQRTFLMFPDKADETEQWIQKLTNAIDQLKGNSGSSQRVEIKPPTREEIASSPRSESTPTAVTDSHKRVASEEEQELEGVRLCLKTAKDLIPYIQEAEEGADEGKIFDFWTIWADSIPPANELDEGAIVFEVSTSADMDKLSWRCSGPQSIFIQRMVDFFWNVGAPESEIDRLNDVGSDVNPTAIGSWIDMSSSNGMDGGWFFPVEISMKQVFQASDDGEAVQDFEKWIEPVADECRVFYIGRDMGAAPPRQTECKFYLPGHTYQEQLEFGLSAYAALGVPEIPKDALQLLENSTSAGLAMSVVTSCEGIVRLGLMAPNPSKQTVASLSHFSGVPSPDELHNFEAALGVSGPAWVEFQCLMKGFGYGVYREGFEIIFHYAVGSEHPQ